jgi:hypothetical protein
MPDDDRGFKVVAHAASRYLARVAKLDLRDWEPVVGELQMTERLADRVFRARRGRGPVLVYFEAYTYWDPAAPWSVLAKSGLLSERDRLPTVSVIFVLHPKGYKSAKGTLRLEAGGLPTQQVWFTEVRLWEQDPEAWWEEVPALMTLYPLCRHRQSPEEAVKHAARVIGQTEGPSNERADYLALLGIFATLLYPKLEVFDWIGRESMMESPFMEEWLKEERQQAILEVLELRFGKNAVAEVTAAIKALTKGEQLKELHRKAVLCSSPDEFRAALAKAKPTRKKRGPR